MYRKILVALENSKADLSLVPHVQELAKWSRAQLLLLHVADGWAARNFDKLKLAESEEIKADRDYLERTAAQLRSAGLDVSVLLAIGDPRAAILKAATHEHCDLIAITSAAH